MAAAGPDEKLDLDIGPPPRLIRQHSKEHKDQIKLIRQSSKDWVEKHSKCALTDIVVDSHTGYILTRDPTCAYHIPALKEALRNELKTVKETIIVKREDSIVSPADLSLLLNEHEYYTWFARLYRQTLDSIDHQEVKVADKVYRTNPDHAKVVEEIQNLAQAVKEKKSEDHDSNWFVSKAFKAIRQAMKWTCPDDYSQKLNLFGGKRFESETDFDSRARFLQLHWVLTALDLQFQKVVGRKLHILSPEELDKLESEDAKGGPSGATVKALTEDEKKELAKKKKVNAGGVGYDYNSGSDASVADAMEEKAKLVQAEDVITAAYFELVNAALSDPIVMYDLPLPVYARLYHSTLNMFLAHFLIQDSLSELVKRMEVYRSVCKLMRTLGSNPHTLPIIRADDVDQEERLGDQRALMKMLLKTKRQAAMFVDAAASNKNLEAEDLLTLGLANDVVDVCGLLETQATIYKTTKKKLVNFSASDSKEEKKAATIEEKDLMLFMQGAQFATMDIMNGPISHHYKSDLLSSSGVTAKGRLRKEIATLTSSLPPGIYIRVDQQRFDCIRAILTGPYDTPYEDGLFLFDIMLPSDYPNSPPKVCFETTGKGTFRFNANLYNNGKVCLSILGTWAGPGWDPKISTLLQVLISIQAMILCDEPYYNEPGWAYDKGTEREKNAHIYHAQIRHATMLYAMLDYIKEPPYGFEDVVKGHFYMKKDKLLKMADQWEKMHEGLEVSKDIYTWSGTTVIKTPIADAVKDLKAALNELQPPNLTPSDD